MKIPTQTNSKKKKSPAFIIGAKAPSFSSAEQALIFRQKPTKKAKRLLSAVLNSKVQVAVNGV